MNAERRKLQVRVAILRSLDQLSGMVEPQDSLLATVRMSVQPVVLQSEFSSALRDLEESNLIVGTRDELSDLVKWGLTDRGRMYMTQLN